MTKNLTMVRTHYFGLGVSVIGLTIGELDFLLVKEKVQSIFVPIIGHDNPEGSTGITLRLL